MFVERAGARAATSRQLLAETARTTTEPIARFKVHKPEPSRVRPTGRFPGTMTPAACPTSNSRAEWPASGRHFPDRIFGMASETEIDTWLAGYRQTLLEMHATRVEVGGSTSRWNRLADRLQRLHLQLRKEARGRAGITRLINDEVLTIRQWAATHALFWAEAEARAELERQAGAGQTLAEFEAEIVLREYDAGRLNTSWTPK
jgi:hypothetical protein